MIDEYDDGSGLWLPGIEENSLDTIERDIEKTRTAKVDLAACPPGLQSGLDTANTKPSNPKDALGVAKVPYSVIPQPVIAEVGVALLEGALKYGRHSYRAIGVRASVYFDACVARHLAAFWEGENTDPDSGLSHITKAIAGLIVLRDSMIQGNWIDDRPPPSPREWLDVMNAKVRALLAKYPEPVAPYYAHGERGPGKIIP